jgi:hypothetical protein
LSTSKNRLNLRFKQGFNLQCSNVLKTKRPRLKDLKMRLNQVFCECLAIKKGTIMFLLISFVERAESLLIL